MKLKRGSTSIRRLIFVGDSSSTTGAGLANLLHNTSGLVAYYFAGDLSNEVSIPLASATLGSYTDGGFVAVDNTNMPGWYEFGIPNGALDGGNEVAIQLRGAANMVPVNVYIELDTVDYQTDAFGALKPTTAGRTLDVSAGGEAGIDLANVGSPSTTLNLSGTTIKTATDIETDTQDIQNRLPSGLVDGRMRSIAEVVGDKTNYKLASDGLSLVTSWAVGITGNITGNLSGSVGSVTGNVGGNVTGSVGSISGVTFPTNFAALGINSSGHVSRVVLVDTTTTNTDMRGTDGAALATHWTSTRAGYLDGVLISANYNQRTVAVTGSNHVAADIHELQPAVIDNTHFAPGAIDANALAADAITEVQNGLALEASSQSILARIGAFTGTGVNTILGFFRALLRSDASITTPSDVGGTYTHTTDSTQAIRDRGDAAWITGSGGGGGGGGSGAGTYPSLQVPPYPLAVYMTSDLFTYADIVQRLRDKRGLEGSARQMHALKVAVQDALTELAGRSTWRHYNRRVAVTTKAVVQKTASFDTATDILSIATGTWPTDAQYGEVVFDNQRYKVASRISDTELLLSSLTAPQASFTNKAVTWMQASYALPVMFRQIRSVIDEDAYRPLEYMSPADAVRHRKLARTTGQTLRYTLRSSENYMGLKEIEFSPVPAQATRFEIALIVRPRPFKTYELTGVDGAYTTGTQTFTSATAAFSATHVGCILRISATATLPKGPTVFDESRVDFAVQAFITEVVSATEVKVSLPFTATASGKGYTVSDPADIDPTSMLAALDALAWEKYCLNIDMPAEALSAARVLAKEEFDRGIAADSADTNQPESAINYDVDTFEDFEPNVDVMGGQ